MPQRARRSPDVWTPPKLVASMIIALPAKNRSTAAASASVKQTTAPTPGQRTSVTSSRPRSSAASAAAVASWRSTRTPSVASDRCASQVSTGPGIAPVSPRQARSRSSHPASLVAT